MDSSLLVLGYLLIINTVALFVMGGDKFSAAKNSDNRTPEGILFFLAVIGGTGGVLAGMFLFRHKTRKWYFLLGLPILLFQQIFLLEAVLGDSLQSLL